MPFLAINCKKMALIFDINQGNPIFVPIYAYQTYVHVTKLN